VAPEISKAPQVFHDLDAIATFIAQDNPHAAIRFLNSLEDRFRLLAASPGIGRLYPDLSAGIRGLTAGDYIIFYRQVASGVEIVRVLHSARDIESLFREN
jgi:toxin ParE1/3/4